MPHEAPYGGHVDWISGGWLRHMTPRFNLRVPFPDACNLAARLYACTHTHTHTHTHGHSSGLNCLVGLPTPPAERWGGMRVGDDRLYFQGPHRPAASKRQQPDDKPAPGIYSTGRATPLRQPPHLRAGHTSRAPPKRTHIDIVHMRFLPCECASPLSEAMPDRTLTL